MSLLRPIAPVLILLLGAASGVGVVACGDDEGNARLLPEGPAADIVQNLDDVEQLLDECEVAGAADAVGDVQVEVEKVSDRIEPELRDNLLEGTARLDEKVRTYDCEQTATEPTTTEEEEPATTEETIPETTAEEPTTTEEEPPTEEPPPATTEEPPPATPPAEPPSPPSTTPPSSGGVGPGQSAGGGG